MTAERTCPTPEPFRDKIGIIFFLAVLFFLCFSGRVIFAPLMAAIERELALNHAQAGSLFLWISVGVFMAQILSGVVSSRLNHWGALVISALMVGLALLPFGLTRSLGTIHVLVVILGLATGLHTPSAIATITASVSRNDWGKALGVHQAAPSMALVFAPLLAVALSSFLSWQNILSSLGGVALVTGVLFVFFGKCGTFPGEAPNPAAVKSIVIQPSFWIMAALFSMAMAGSSGIYTMLPLYLVSERGFGVDRANFLVGLSRVSGLFTAFFGGWIADLVGEKQALAGALFLSGLGTILLGVLPNSGLVIMLFLQPALAACFFPAAFSALSRIVPPHLRSLTSSLSTPLAGFIGTGVVPAFVGHMGETRTFALGIVIVGCCMTIMPVSAFFLKLRDKTEEGC
ncbi:MAG: MFS transporter [Desulfobacterales bacterium]|nr:MFS transporter [Desulfobacterales bacterium]